MLIKVTRDIKLRNFISNTIQGSQVPIYTNTHCFCIFHNFLFFYWKKKRNQQQQSTKTNKQTNKQIQKLDWLKPQQPTMHEIKKVNELLGIFFVPDRRPGWRTFLLHKPLFRWIRRRVESIEVWELHDSFKKFSKKG